MMASLINRLLIASALLSTWAAAVPFVASGHAPLQQTSLKEEDPLKDFVSDVASDKASLTPPQFLPPPNPSVSLRLSFDVNELDHEAINFNDDGDDQEQPVDQTLTRPSWFTSVLLARRLLALSSVGIASTVYQDSHPRHAPNGLRGVSVTLPEYIADCHSLGGIGNPILLGLYVSTTFQNVASGSNISLSIDWWDHLDKTSPLYPGFPLSAAGLPRVSLLGYIERFSSSDSHTREELEKCFLSLHPDAEAWLPGNPDTPHAGFWARMEVTQAYWIGGFGDLQQIGWINMTEWRGVDKERSLPGIGDGRGWDDVRLPGEDV